MLDDTKKVEILEKALITELYELSQLGSVAEPTGGVNIYPEHFDNRLFEVFKVEWSEDIDNLPYFKVMPRA